MKINKSSIEAGFLKDAIKKLGKALDKQFSEATKKIQSEVKDMDISEKNLVATIFPSLDEQLEPYFMKIDKLEYAPPGKDYTGSGWMSFKDPDGNVYSNVLQLFFKADDEQETSEPSPKVDNSVDDKLESEIEEKQEEETPVKTMADFLSGEILNLEEMEYVMQQFENRVMTKFRNPEAQTAASTQVTLSRVVSGDEISVELSSVFSTYDTYQAMDDIYDVVNDDVFVEQIPEAETTYILTPEEDSIDVGVCECPTDIAEVKETSCNEMLSQLWYLKSVVFANKMNISGKNAQEIFYLLDTLSWDIDDSILAIANILKINGRFVPNLCDISTCCEKNSYFDFSTLKPTFESIQRVVFTIETFKVNFNDVEQQELNRIELTWKNRIANELARLLPC